MISSQEFLTQNNHKKVYIQIVRKFISLIESGGFELGKKLPSERELARQLEVSRASLREALTVMKMMGLVETISGQGTYISSKSNTNMLGNELPNLGESPFVILQARKVFEPAIAALAAKQREQSSLKIMAKILAKVEADHTKDQVIGEVFSEGDRQFHLEIARATRNPILFSAQKMIHDLMGQQLWLALMRHTSFTTLGRYDEAIKEHHRIFDAIRDRDAELASIRMKAHLLRVEKLMEQADLGLNFPINVSSNIQSKDE